MVCNSNSEANGYFPELIAWETDGERTPAQTYDGQELVNLGGVVLVTRETADALEAEAA